MGAGLGLALSAGGYDVTLLVRTERPTPSGVGRSAGEAAWRAPLGSAAVVIVATPDGAITDAAKALAGLGAIGAGQVVLHLSGLLDRRALAPLEPAGASLGSFHPLQAVADPASAPARLHGAYAALEGDAAAVAAGERLARAVGMTPVSITAGAKPAYHAAAAMASNYVVALADTARRIAETGGVPAAMARDMYLPLMRGTVENVLERGAAAALTGAIRRGDAGTVAAHLAALSGADRELYARLGREALRLAVEAGLGTEAAQRVEAVLRAPGGVSA